jgi:hypothetical protein
MKQFCSCVWRPWPKIKTPTKIESTQCIRYQGLPFMLALVLSRGLRSLTKHNHPFTPSSLEVLWHSIQRKHITSYLSVYLLKLHSDPVMHWAHTGLFIVFLFLYAVCHRCCAQQAILEQATIYVTMHSINMSMQWWPKCWTRSQLGNVQVSYLGGITWQLSLVEND